MNNEFNPEILNEKGLNLQSIFNIDELPKDMISALTVSVPSLSQYNQLIVIGHGGKTMWNSLSSDQLATSDPIDDYSVSAVTSFINNNNSISDFKFIYPSNTVIPLQSLGLLAGWHHSSLFRIGINDKWGSWFAYRVVVLTQSNFETTVKMEGDAPCAKCVTKDCIKVCPVGAVTEENFEFEKCFAYRKQPNSKCIDRSLARIICPVATEHSYPEEQIKYHYGRSLQSLKNM
ncbi:MAG: hypothetical protein HOM01_13815 [Kordiimonadaceae bacterium]|nr:hypothetical protein [Kordiimonadaceae bacterium]